MVLNAAMEELQDTLRQRAQSAMELLHQGIISTEQKLEQCLGVLSSVQDEVRQHQQAAALTIQDDYTKRLQELTDAFEQQVLSLQQETQSQLEDLQTAAADALQQAAQVLLHELQLDYPADAAIAAGSMLSTEPYSQDEVGMELSFAALKRPASPDQTQQSSPTTLEQGPGGPHLVETHWHNQGQAGSGRNQSCSRAGSRASSQGRRAASLLAPAEFCNFSSVTAKGWPEAQHTGADTLPQPWDQAPAEAVIAEPPTWQLSGPCHATSKQQPPVMQPQQQLQGEEQQQDAARREQPLQQQQQQQPGQACIEHAVQAVLPAPTLHTASTVGASAHQRSRAGSFSIKAQAELQSPQPLHSPSSTAHQQQHHRSTDCQYVLGSRRQSSEEGWQIRAAEQPAGAAGGCVAAQQSLGDLQPPSSPGLSGAHQPFCKAYRSNSFSSNSTSTNSRPHSMCGNDLTSTHVFATPTVSPSPGSEPRQQRWQTQAEPSRQLRKVASLPGVQECAAAKQRSLRKCVSSTEYVLRRAPSWRQQLESGWQQGLAKAAGKAAATSVNSLDDVATMTLQAMTLQAKLTGQRGSLAACDVSSDDDDGVSPSTAAAAAVKHLPGLAVKPPRKWQQSFDMASNCNVQVAAQNGAVKRSSSMCNSSKFSKAGATSCKLDRHCSSFLELLEC